jgi:hypothetical protein
MKKTRGRKSRETVSLNGKRVRDYKFRPNLPLNSRISTPISLHCPFKVTFLKSTLQDKSVDTHHEHIEQGFLALN